MESSNRRSMSPGCIVTLLVIVIFLLTINILVSVTPALLSPQYETRIIDCKTLDELVKEDWRVVAAYSYEIGNNVSGYTVYNECVVERSYSPFMEGLTGSR